MRKPRCNNEELSDATMPQQDENVPSLSQTTFRVHASSHQEADTGEADFPARLRSPISKMPVELLSRIFTMASWGDFLHIFPTYPRTHKGPSRRLTSLALTHVCAQWREVALQTRGMWDFVVTFHGAATEDESTDRYNRRLEQLTELFNTHMPAVHFNFTTTEPEWKPRVTYTLKGYNSHYTSLRLTRMKFFKSSSSRKVEMTMPRLKELVLTALDNPHGINAALHAPQLKKLILSRICLSVARIIYIAKRALSLNKSCSSCSRPLSTSLTSA
ncbi:hypothetical protein NMY22_g4613 [Coprinellus aureogranulatus]|nr:hypothetical protein NMY22_g4613 [Coprinellus aureogranulatus]